MINANAFDLKQTNGRELAPLAYVTRAGIHMVFIPFPNGGWSEIYVISRNTYKFNVDIYIKQYRLLHCVHFRIKYHRKVGKLAIVDIVSRKMSQIHYVGNVFPCHLKDYVSLFWRRDSTNNAYWIKLKKKILPHNYKFMTLKIISKGVLAALPPGSAGRIIFLIQISAPLNSSSLR